MPTNRNLEILKKAARALHNRAVRAHFKDLKSDTDTSNGRNLLRAALIILKADSAVIINQKIALFQHYIKGFDDLKAIATVPDTWELKVQVNRPQLAVVFRPTNKETTSYETIIPHYNGDKTPTTIPKYKKGNHWGKLTLKDNSKIIVYAYNQNEAERVIKKLADFVKPKYLPAGWINSIVFGQLPKGKFKEITVEPIFADYYPKGKFNQNSQWRYYFNR